MTTESRFRRTLRGVAPGVFGLATLTIAGCPGYYYSAEAYFANTTREPVTVRILELQADATCSRLVGRSAQALAHRDLFGQGKTYEVGPGEALPLSLGDDEATGSIEPGCAVLLQLLGQPDQVVSWPTSVTATTSSRLAPVKDERFRAVSLRLEGAGTVRGLALGDALEVTPLSPATSAVDELEPRLASFGWSGLATSRPSVKVWERQVLPDGCVELGLGASQAELASLYLCLPDWAVPFDVGQTVDVRVEELENATSYYAERGSQARHLTLAASSPRRRLELWLNASPDLVSIVTAVSQASGDGYRTPCGGYADPLTVQLAEGTETLAVGTLAERETAGYRRRAMLGRADEMLVAPDACGDEYGALGARFDLLLLEEWEETP